MAKGQRENIKKHYRASPTGKQFHTEGLLYKVRGIRGPIGSGKSVMCVQEVLRRCYKQAPDSQNKRRSRWAIVRNTYPELKSTTIKTWQDWIPDEVAHVTYDSPIRCDLILNLRDGSQVEAEIYFMALDKPKDIKKLLSLELTGAWVNEAREISRAIIDGVDSRLGRYPGKHYGAPITWTGMIMDTNPPDDKHWWAELEQSTPEGWKFYVQPPALIELANGKYKPNPAAENVENHQLGYNYWLKQLPGKTKEWIKVYILNQFGILIEGKGVYKDHWLPTLHVSELNLWPIKHNRIYLGWDFGLTPSCIICQLTPFGQLRVLDELTTEQMGIERFAKDVVLPLLKEKYRRCEIVSVGDPAGVAKSSTDERTCFEVLDEVLAPLKIITEPTNSNDPTSRWEAVRWFLSRTTPDQQPCFIIDPRCDTLIRGFAGGYHFKIAYSQGSDIRLRERAEKNAYSHPHDALQYAALEAQNDLKNGRL